ncbi:hypothetical protein [Streptomyces sp. NPDC087270]
MSTESLPPLDGSPSGSLTPYVRIGPGSVTARHTTTAVTATHEARVAE